METPASPKHSKKLTTEIGLNSKATKSITQLNLEHPQTSELNPPVANLTESLLRKEKLELIAKIMTMYPLEELEAKVNKQSGYGEVFDQLYEKDLTELKITHRVYSISRK